MSTKKRFLLTIALILGLPFLILVSFCLGSTIFYILSIPPELNNDNLPFNNLHVADVPLVEWKGQVFHQGDIVRTTTLWVGVIHPEESGYPKPLCSNPGRYGIALRAKERDPNLSFVIPGEPLQSIVVLWLDQEWSLFPAFWKHVQVESFTTSTHADHLEKVFPEP